jgi:hypothetical protein
MRLFDGRQVSPALERRSRIPTLSADIGFARVDVAVMFCTIGPKLLDDVVVERLEGPGVVCKLGSAQGAQVLICVDLGHMVMDNLSRRFIPPTTSAPAGKFATARRGSPLR